MKKHRLSPSVDGFYGVWYPNPKGQTKKAIIVMLGDSSEGRLVVSTVKWLHQKGCHALTMSPDKGDHGHHSYPLERFGRAIGFLKSHGCGKVGFCGASTTGVTALIAASYYPEITLTIALAPSDFVMEGFCRDGKDGMKERPTDSESIVSWRGESLPYLPYAYRHPEYWRQIQRESRASGNMIASRAMFDESERRHPVTEEEKIKVERIHGKVVCVGAEDDVLWDTCTYIRRMQDRVKSLPHECDFEAWCYEHGTHFVFPQSLLTQMLPIGSRLALRMVFKAAKEHPKECQRTREDIDRRLTAVLQNW